MAKQSITVNLNEPRERKCPHCQKIFNITKIKMIADDDLATKGEGTPVKIIVKCPHCNKEFKGAGFAKITGRKKDPAN